MVTVSVQGNPHERSSWLSLARRCETAGVPGLSAADHPGARANPYVALAAAAAVTERIRLSAYVTNLGVREPMLVAVDVASLDVVSGGRAVLAVGAGHTPAEWRAVGRERPGVGARVRRLMTATAAVRDLLAGEHVDVDTDEVTVHGRLDGPRPVQEPVPLTVGTSNARLLRWAGEVADVVGLAGLGRTLEDGYSHDVRWTTDAIDAQVAQVAAGAAGRVTPRRSRPSSSTSPSPTTPRRRPPGWRPSSG